MDPGFYQDLTGRLDGLLTVLEDRLNCEDVPVIHQFTGACYDALVPEEIAQTVANRQIGITVRENLEKLETGALVAQIEAKVGADLQFIRLNGAVVGGLVGIAIAAVHWVAH